MITHFLGFPQRGINNIKKLCRENNIYLIEDCAHCCGGKFNKKPLGLWGDISIFSLRKSLNIIHGGALVINNKKLERPSVLRPSFEVVNLDLFIFLGYRNEYINPGASIVPFLKKTTESKDPYGPRHDKFGGYRLGISNFSKMIIKKLMIKGSEGNRYKIYQYYLNFFKKHKGKSFRPLIEELDASTRPMFFPLIVDDSEKIHSFFIRKNLVIAQPFWSHIHNIIDFTEYPDAYFLKKKTMVLPLNHKISEEDLLKFISYLK